MTLKNDLWQRQYNERMPPLGDEFEIRGIDLNLLDIDSAGCISSYIKQGMLDPWRLSTLGICYGELCTVVPLLEGERNKYFERWQELTLLILREIYNKTEKEHG